MRTINIESTNERVVNCVPCHVSFKKKKLCAMFRERVMTSYACARLAPSSRNIFTPSPQLLLVAFWWCGVVGHRAKHLSSL